MPLMKVRRGQPPESIIDSVHENSSCGGDDRASNLSTGSAADIACSFSLETLGAQPSTLPIIDHTIGFSTMGGPSAKKGIDFLEWLDEYDRRIFSTFLSLEVNRFLYEWPDMDESDGCLIGLRPPGLNRHKIVIQATVTLTFHVGTDDVVIVPFPESVLAHFRSVSWHQGQTLRKKKRDARHTRERPQGTSPVRAQAASGLGAQVIGAEGLLVSL
jgi:hypothetical protein